LYGWKPTAAHNWYTDRTQTTVWNFDRPMRSEEHPTMKPIALIEYPITNSSQTGEIVLDLFGGSGSTMIACEKHSRPLAPPGARCQVWSGHCREQRLVASAAAEEHARRI
jgi:hypothetical protein